MLKFFRSCHVASILYFILILQFKTSGKLSISEGAIVGTRKLLEPSILPGRTLQGPFTIINGNEGSYFQLQVTPSQDGSGVAYLHLETRKRLDRELTPQFKLNITNGHGYLDLIVTILDINDNPPVFDQVGIKNLDKYILFLIF